MIRRVKFLVPRQHRQRLRKKVHESEFLSRNNQMTRPAKFWRQTISVEWPQIIFPSNSLVGGADLTDLTESLSNGRRKRKSSYNNNKCFILPYGLSDS
jgi:hypothetical protein